MEGLAVRITHKAQLASRLCWSCNVWSVQCRAKEIFFITGQRTGQIFRLLLRFVRLPTLWRRLPAVWIILPLPHGSMDRSFWPPWMEASLPDAGMRTHHKPLIPMSPAIMPGGTDGRAGVGPGRGQPAEPAAFPYAVSCSSFSFRCDRRLHHAVQGAKPVAYCHSTGLSRPELNQI